MKINEALHYFKQGYLNEWSSSPYITALILKQDKGVSLFLIILSTLVWDPALRTSVCPQHTKTDSNKDGLSCVNMQFLVVFEKQSNNLFQNSNGGRMTLVSYLDCSCM